MKHKILSTFKYFLINLPPKIFPYIHLFLWEKRTLREDIRNLTAASVWAHARSTRCCLFTNQAWNIPLCWPAQFLYLRHWSLRQDADWLLSAGEQWWKYLQSSEEKKKKKKATNTDPTNRFVFRNVFYSKFQFVLP